MAILSFEALGNIYHGSTLYKMGDVLELDDQDKVDADSIDNLKSLKLIKAVEGVLPKASKPVSKNEAKA